MSLSSYLGKCITSNVCGVEVSGSYSDKWDIVVQLHSKCSKKALITLHIALRSTGCPEIKCSSRFFVSISSWIRHFVSFEPKFFRTLTAVPLLNPHWACGWIVGPNKLTMNDMWHMVWQLRCSRIVMVSNLIEDGRVSILASIVTWKLVLSLYLWFFIAFIMFALSLLINDTNRVFDWRVYFCTSTLLVKRGKISK